MLMLPLPLMQGGGGRLQAAAAHGRSNGSEAGPAGCEHLLQTQSLPLTMPLPLPLSLPLGLFRKHW